MRRSPRLLWAAACAIGALFACVGEDPAAVNPNANVQDAGVQDANVGATSDSESEVRPEDAQPVVPDAGALRVFVTSLAPNGDLGGRNGADQICNAAAASAGAVGVFVAWLSTSTESAIRRLPTSGVWALTGGTPVADYAGLASNVLFHGVDENERGEVTGNVLAWTGTKSNGELIADTDAGTCKEWTLGASGYSGWIGRPILSDGGWTDQGTTGCDIGQHLICFQVGR